MINSQPFSRHHACRVSDALSYLGQRMVVLENELLRVVVLPEKGAEISELCYKPADVDPLLRLPASPRPVSTYPATIPGQLGAFMDGYWGGWQEMFPNAGGPCQVNGAELGQHGEVTLLPWRWQILEDRPERVSVRFWVRTVRTPFYLERTMSLESGRAVMTMDECVINESEQELPFIWGHHAAYGRPFIDGPCTIDAAAAGVHVHDYPADPAMRLIPGSKGPWPVMPGAGGDPVDLRVVPSPDGGAVDMLYLTDLYQGWYALVNHDLELGIAMCWPAELFPVIWVWQEMGGSGGYPFYHRANALGLEPVTGYAPTEDSGLAEAIKGGHAKYLKGGESLSASLQTVVFPTGGAPGVEEVTSDGQVKLRQS